MANGTTRTVRIIKPGIGSEGYYSPEVIQKYGPHAFPQGTHFFSLEENHEGKRGVRNLAGVSLEDARWVPDHPEGAGLYAKTMIFPSHNYLLEKADYIGVSINAFGSTVIGDLPNGGKGRVISKIVASPFNTYEAVTRAGAGGKILKEALSNAECTDCLSIEAELLTEEQNTMSDEMKTQLTEMQSQLAQVLEENKSLREAQAQQTRVNGVNVMLNENFSTLSAGQRQIVGELLLSRGLPLTENKQIDTTKLLEAAKGIVANMQTQQAPASTFVGAQQSDAQLFASLQENAFKPVVTGHGTNNAPAQQAGTFDASRLGSLFEAMPNPFAPKTQ